MLRNKVSQDKVPEKCEEVYYSELNRWIENGWLIPCDTNKYGIILLICVKQENKGKIRIVMDFRELNQLCEVPYNG